MSSENNYVKGRADKKRHGVLLCSNVPSQLMCARGVPIFILPLQHENGCHNNLTSELNACLQARILCNERACSDLIRSKNFCEQLVLKMRMAARFNLDLFVENQQSMKKIKRILIGFDTRLTIC